MANKYNLEQVNSRLIKSNWLTYSNICCIIYGGSFVIKEFVG